jgi:hypothetical protein
MAALRLEREATTITESRNNIAMSITWRRGRRINPTPAVRATTPMDREYSLSLPHRLPSGPATTSSGSAGEVTSSGLAPLATTSPPEKRGAGSKLGGWDIKIL